MEQPYHQQGDIFAPQQRALPNATAVLVLGILSIVFCFICGIVALSLASGDRRRYMEQPQAYTSASHELMKAGRICAIIGLCIWAAIILFYIAVFVFAVGFSSVNRFN
jgi:ABC-type Fe3+ transport system permease subunit